MAGSSALATHRSAAGPMTPPTVLRLPADESCGTCSCTWSSSYPWQHLAKAWWAMFQVWILFCTAYPQSTCCIWPHQGAAMWWLLLFPCFPWHTSVLTLAFGYSARGISGPSGYEELQSKFQMLYCLDAWRLCTVIKSLLCTKKYVSEVVVARTGCHTSSATVLCYAFCAEP